jgi:deazaflavin-dependent oxidoreductase (nitroreductase family)|tara:strand:- start:57 stop:431 length:375 start_codon:yes stop_codon:yes gene_type:complete
MLIHVGSNSGRIRRTVLEVIRHNKSSGESIVISAYGIKADWYRNIILKPALEIQIGKKKFVPIQRLLSEDEAFDEFVEYERLHPFAVKNLSKLIGIQYDGSENGRKLLVDSFRMISFRPRSIDD